MTSLDEQKRTNYVLSFTRKNVKLTSNGTNSLRLCESNNYFVQYKCGRNTYFI